MSLMENKKGLLVDIGNSNTELAVFEQKEIRKRFEIQTEKLDSFLATFDLSKYEKIVISFKFEISGNLVSFLI